MDEPDLFERVALAHEVFGTELPDEWEILTSSSNLADWLELRLIGWGPNSEAAQLLKRMARLHNNPALAEGLHSEWRREQIVAVLREILGEHLR